MKTTSYVLFFCLLLCSSMAFAEAPISDPTLNANFIKQVGQDIKQLKAATDKLENSITTTISLGTIGSLDEFADPSSSLGTNDLSSDVVNSLGNGTTSASTSSADSGTAAKTATASSGSTTFPSASQVRSSVEENLQLPDSDDKLTSEKVATVRKNLPQTKASIATYGVALAWVNRTIATRNISEAKNGTQKKADETQDNRKSITTNTASKTNIAETYNRLLMSGAAANALSAINTMEQAGNLN